MMGHEVWVVGVNRHMECTQQRGFWQPYSTRLRLVAWQTMVFAALWGVKGKGIDSPMRRGEKRRWQPSLPFPSNNAYEAQRAARE